MSADIVFRKFILRMLKDLFCWAFFRNFSKVHKDSFIGNSLRLLHIMRYDDDGVLIFQLFDEFFYF